MSVTFPNIWKLVLNEKRETIPTMKAAKRMKQMTSVQLRCFSGPSNSSSSGLTCWEPKDFSYWIIGAPEITWLSLFFYPNRAYWAPCSIATRPPFFLSQHTVRDAPPWGTRLRTLHWWRRVGNNRRRRKKLITRLDLNPWLPDCEACALLLCYNHGQG